MTSLMTFLSSDPRTGRPDGPGAVGPDVPQPNVAATDRRQAAHLRCMPAVYHQDFVPRKLGGCGSRARPLGARGRATLRRAATVSLCPRSMPMILRDKVAIVTGSSRGIGAATAKLLAAHGAKVTVNYAQSREKGEKVVEEIVRVGGKAILVHADVTEREDVEAMVEKTEAALGPV